MRRFRVLAAVASAGVFVLVACGGGGGGGGNNTGTNPPQTGTVTGVVRDQNDAGVTGATLTLSKSGSASLTQQSGTGGTFTFSSVSTGTWTLEITPPACVSALGSESATKSVAVTANQTATVNFSIQKLDEANIVQVNVVDFRFDPSTVTIDPGQTVCWRAQATGHTVTSETGEWTEWAFPAIGQTFSHTFTESGNFDYICVPHEVSNNMVGVVTVR